MQIQNFLTLYGLAFVLFAVIDFLWLGIIASDFYRSKIGFLMGDIRLIPALLFYAVFALGLTFFALYPAATKGTYATALTLGALFGFFTYATYDLTNLATLKGWPTSLVIVDILWGVVLSATVTLIAFLIFDKML